MECVHPTQYGALSRPEPKGEALTVSIVICTHRRAELLENCLKAVASLRKRPNELIVVDNTDGDKRTRSVAQMHNARYIVEPRLGLSRARNRGLKESNSAVVAYLDDDCVPHEEWLGLLLEPFSDGDVAIATGGVTSQEAVPAETEHLPARFLSNHDPKWFETAAFGGLGIGCNMALLKAACADWGLFDERLGRGAPVGGSEESHAFITLLSRGFRAIHIPTAIVIHPSKPIQVQQEASRAIAYWLLLFFEFPGHRIDLLQFLFRRLRHKPLAWQRSSPEIGPMITSGWRVRTSAGLGGILLYLRARKWKSS
jgi:glycosyltransferase involved in cell wall biosynthesis